MSINVERLRELADRFNLAVYRGDLLSIAHAMEATERELAMVRNALAASERLRESEEAECDALRADAERYRWLRKVCPAKVAMHIFSNPSYADVDAAIDRERK